MLGFSPLSSLPLAALASALLGAAVGASSGVGVATGVGLRTATTVGVSTATTTAAAYGGLLASGASTASSSATGVGLLTAAAAGASTGSALASATGLSTTVGAGSTVGRATANGVPFGVTAQYRPLAVGAPLQRTITLTLGVQDELVAFPNKVLTDKLDYTFDFSLAMRSTPGDVITGGGIVITNADGFLATSDMFYTDNQMTIWLQGGVAANYTLACSIQTLQGRAATRSATLQVVAVL